jgi:hypothetical protein
LALILAAAAIALLAFLQRQKARLHAVAREE